MQDATRRPGTPSTSNDGQPRRWFRDVYRDAIWEAEDLSAAEKAVAETYMRHARDERGNKSADADLSWLTYERLMAKAGIRRRANVPPAIAKLVKHGWMEPVEQVGRRPTLYRLTIPSGSSDGGTTTSKARSSDGGTTVVPLPTVGSSTLSNLPHPGSSDGGTPPLLRPLGLTPTSLSQRPPAHDDGRAGRKAGKSDDQQTPSGEAWHQATTLTDKHAPDVVGAERRRLVAAIHAASERGWLESAIDKELARDTAGADSVAAVLIGRMKDLGDPPKAQANTKLGAAGDRREKVLRTFRVSVLNEPECSHGFRGGHLCLPDGFILCPHARSDLAANTPDRQDIRDVPTALSSFLRELEDRGLDAEAEQVTASLTDAQLDALPEVKIPQRR